MKAWTGKGSEFTTDLDKAERFITRKQAEDVASKISPLAEVVPHPFPQGGDWIIIIPRGAKGSPSR